MNFDLKIKFKGFFDTCSCPVHNLFFWFYICVPYLAHGCITLRRCVAYFQDPDTTLNFDLEVKFIGVLSCLCVRPITIFYMTLAKHIRTWVYHHERMFMYIYVPDSMLTFDLKVKCMGFCHVFMLYLYFC